MLNGSSKIPLQLHPTPVTSPSQVIVVGGGLAGMSAANTVVEHGGRTLLLDKSSFCGGNSTKAGQFPRDGGEVTQGSTKMVIEWWFDSDLMVFY